jgi:hypothetical protein
MRPAKALAVLAVVAVAGSAAVASDLKPFPLWSEKDVEKLLTDSPWAGKAALTHARDGANLGQVPDWKLIVTVRSALPIRQALLLQSLGPGAAIPPQAENVLAAAPARYVLAISGIPRLYQSQLTKSALEARLKVKGKAPVAATDASVVLLDKDGKTVAAPTRGQLAAPGPRVALVAQRGGRGAGGAGGFSFGTPEQTDKSGITATLVIEFPKTTAITIDDSRVELSTVIGAYNVQKEFKLKDMLFMGELAF